MNQGPRISRFCTCSDLPAHLVGRDLAKSVEEELGSASIDAGSSIASLTPRFCTCSDRPSHLMLEPGAAPSSNVGVVGVDAADAGTEPEVEYPKKTVAPPPASQSVQPVRSTQAAGAVSPSLANGGDVEPAILSVSDLLPGESSLYSELTHGRGGSEVVLTEHRVLLRGSPDAKILHASMRLTDIDAVRIERGHAKRRSLAWGLIGFGAAIGMWQALDGVGNLRLFIAAAVVLMSLVLLADYFLRPPDLVVSLSSRSGTELAIDFGQSHSEEADRFAAQVISKLEILTPS